MASRQSRGGPGAPAQPPARQNNYFVPRDGIDREVISADICRYLGNDALVRPGQYEDPETGQVVQGYSITGYRNLTTAMIDDLKADSARWDSERRSAQTARAPSSGVQYHLSETHQDRQHFGPSETGHPQDPYKREHAQPSYPGTNAPGYSGAGPQFGTQPGYAQQGGNSQYHYQLPQGQQSPQPVGSYVQNMQPGSMMNPGYGAAQEPPYVSTGANSNRYDPYAAGRSGVSGAAPQQPMYAPAPPTQGYNPAYQQYPNHPPQGQHPSMQPPVDQYGRAGQTQSHQQPPYPGQPMAAYQGYDGSSHARGSVPSAGGYDGSSVSRASVPSASTAQAQSQTQAPPSGSSGRRSERESSDRHTSERHPSDRHASDRHRSHRQR